MKRAKKAVERRVEVRWKVGVLRVARRVRMSMERL
jgi:hypothetical protein